MPIHGDRSRNFNVLKKFPRSNAFPLQNWRLAKIGRRLFDQRAFHDCRDSSHSSTGEGPTSGSSIVIQGWEAAEVMDVLGMEEKVPLPNIQNGCFGSPDRCSYLDPSQRQCDRRHRTSKGQVRTGICLRHSSALHDPCLLPTCQWLAAKKWSLGGQEIGVGVS